MTTYYPQLLASRILSDADRSSLSAADDGNVTNFVKGKFLLATQIGYDSKDTAASAYKLQWRVSGGTPADVASTGKIKWASSSAVLTDGTAVTSTTRRCSSKDSSMTWQNGLESVGDNLCPDSGTLDLGSNCYSELQWALDCSDADDDKTYEFSLYNNTRGVAVGTAGCTLGVVPASRSASVFSLVQAAEEVTPDLRPPPASYLEMDIYSSVSVAEFLATLINPVYSTIYDTVGVSDDAAAVSPRVDSSVYDTIGVSEYILGGLCYSIDTEKAWESVGGSWEEVCSGILWYPAFRKKEVYDTIAVSEHLTLTSLSKVEVYDTVHVSENLTLTSLGRASVYDTVGVSESVLAECGVIPLLEADVYDIVAASESLTLTSLGRVSVYDQIQVSELLNLTSLGRASIYDSVGVSEAGEARAPFLASLVYDQIQVSEGGSPREVYLVAELSDIVEVGEEVLRGLGIPARAFDSVSVSDLVEAQLLLGKELADIVQVGEGLTTTNLFIQKVLADLVQVSEDTDRRLNLLQDLYSAVEVSEGFSGSVVVTPRSANLADLVRVSDSFELWSSILHKEVYDTITGGELPDLIILSKGGLAKRLEGDLYLRLTDDIDYLE
jgi:hypothetical protein